MSAPNTGTGATARAPLRFSKGAHVARKAAALTVLALALSACAGKKTNPGPLPGQPPVALTPNPVTPAIKPPVFSPEQQPPATAQPTASPTPATPPVLTGPTAAPPVAKRFTFASLPGWEGGDHAPVLISLRESCGKLTGGAADAGIGGLVLNGEPVFGRGTDWRPICAAAARTETRRARAFFEEWFEPVSINGAGEAGASLYTGYYEPELRGSRVRGGPYQYPIYAKPKDLPADTPYFERAAIQRGALAGRGLELFWVDDPVDSFFLEIQGSGRIRLPDGQVARVGFAGKNGHSYKAIGRTLVEQGVMPLEQVTADSIKDWLRANPDRRDAVMATNKSYVFFIERPELAADPSLGPIGTFGTPLPAMRSIAVDRRAYPLGIPFWVDFNSPVRPLSRLVIALDTGGAIKGARRADFFYGSGDGPGVAAGDTRAMGRLIALAPTAALRRVFRAGS